MVSKNFYLNIVFRACILAISALLLGWVFFDWGNIVLGIFIAVIFAFQVAEIIYFSTPFGIETFLIIEKGFGNDR